MVRFLLQSLVSRSFLVHLRNSFRIFLFHLRWFDGVYFQYSQVVVIFLFSKCSDCFLIWQIYSFRYLSFSTFHYGHFSILNKFPTFWLYICIVCISLQFFFIFCKQFDSIHVHELINIFLPCNIVAASIVLP